VLARVGADQEDPELQGQGGRLAGALLARHRVLVDDDARVVAAGDMDPVVDLIDQLALDEDHRAVGRLSAGRHHDLFCAWWRLAPLNAARVLIQLVGLLGLACDNFAIVFIAIRQDSVACAVAVAISISTSIPIGCLRFVWLGGRRWRCHLYVTPALRHGVLLLLLLLLPAPCFLLLELLPLRSDTVPLLRRRP